MEFKSRRDDRGFQNEIIGHRKNDAPRVQPSRWDGWPCASTPALKRRAIVGCPVGTKAGGEVRRTGIVVEPAVQNESSSVQERHHGGRPQGLCRPAGAEIYFGLGFYKYAAPDGAENRCRQMQFGVDERDNLIRHKRNNRDKRSYAGGGTGIAATLGGQISVVGF